MRDTQMVPVYCSKKLALCTGLYITVKSVCPAAGANVQYLWLKRLQGCAARTKTRFHCNAESANACLGQAYLLSASGSLAASYSG